MHMMTEDTQILQLRIRKMILSQKLDCANVWKKGWPLLLCYINYVHEAFEISNLSLGRNEKYHKVSHEE